MHAKMVMSWRAARYAGEKPDYVVRSPWKPLISNKVGSGCCVVAKLCPTPWTVALQVPLSMGFPRQEYWSEFPFLTPGDLSDPGIQPKNPSSPALAGRFFTNESPRKPIQSGKT